MDTPELQGTVTHKGRREGAREENSEATNTEMRGKPKECDETSQETPGWGGWGEQQCQVKVGQPAMEVDHRTTLLV